MPRKNLIRSSCLPYHVCNRVLDQKFYGDRMRYCWRVYCDAARIVSWAYGARIHALVLMSNHYHLLVTTPDENLDAIMCFFQSYVSRAMAAVSGSSAYCFDTRYRWTLLTRPDHARNVYRYIYQNPLRAGLVEACESYEFSTLQGLVGEGTLDIPLWDLDFGDLLSVAEETEHFLEWINRLPHPKLNSLMRRGLRRREFALTERNQALVEKELGAY